MKQYIRGGLAAFSALLFVSNSHVAEAMDSPAGEWAGAYIGASIGVARSDWNVDYSQTGEAIQPLGYLIGFGDGECASLSCTLPFGSDAFAGIIGGQVGYNFRIGQSVFGLEADIRTGHDDAASTLVSVSSVADELDLNSSVDWMSTVRGRIGYLISEDILVFATGGLAIVDVTSSVDRFCNGCIDQTGEDFAASDKKFGWVVGGGGEWKIDESWSFRTQYLFADFGSLNFNQPIQPFFPATSVSSKLKIHEFSLGMNYGF